MRRGEGERWGEGEFIEHRVRVMRRQCFGRCSVRGRMYEIEGAVKDIVKGVVMGFGYRVWLWGLVMGYCKGCS